MDCGGQTAEFEDHSNWSVVTMRTSNRLLIESTMQIKENRFC